MSREFEAYVRRIVRRPDMGPRTTTNRRAVPLDGQGAGEPASVIGSSPLVTSNTFTGNPDGNFRSSSADGYGTNIMSWRMLPIGRGLGFERYSQSGMRAELTDKGAPEMRYNIVTFA